MNSSRTSPPALLLLAVAILTLPVGIHAQVPTAYDYTRVTPPNRNVGKLLELSNDTIAAAQITVLDLLTIEFPRYTTDYIRGLTDEQRTARFDVVSKIDPPGVTDAVHDRNASRFLIDALLKNHFRLAAHEALEDETTEDLLAIPNRPRPTPCPRHSSQGCISMQILASRLSDELHTKVVNKTDLGGTYVVAFNWSPQDGASREPLDQLISTSLAKQIGVWLSPSRRRVNVVIVDHIEIP